MPKTHKGKPVRCQINGKRYRFANLQAACDYFNLPYQPIYARHVRLGWPLGKALSTPLAPRKARAYQPHPDVVAHYARLKADQTVH